MAKHVHCLTIYPGYTLTHDLSQATVSVADIAHSPILFHFDDCPNDNLSTGLAHDANSILWFYFNESVYLLDWYQQNFPLTLKEIRGRSVAISTHTTLPQVNVYFPSPYALPPIPSPTCLEPAKVDLSPNHGEHCDNNEKY